MKVRFWPAFDTANPKRELTGELTGQGLGTVHLIADDGMGTPHDNVPVIVAGAEHPASGPFAQSFEEPVHETQNADVPQSEGHQDQGHAEGHVDDGRVGGTVDEKSQEAGT